jgi:8-oxo-dGTP pyrophosphatase MutT (NUDIX family)
MPLIEGDARFREIRTALAQPSLRVDRRTRGPIRGPTREAAVSIVLRAGADLEFLLIKRAEATGDPWSGHMALPGGRREKADPNLVATAIRETAEETAVLLDSGWTLGRLESCSPQSTRLPSLSVHPFVFAAPASTSAVADRREVQSVHWVPLGDLFDPANRRTVGIPLIGTVRDFPAYALDGQIVWGMTYRILTRFAEAYRDMTAFPTVSRPTPR